MRLTPPQQEGSSGVAGPGAEFIRRLAWVLAVSRSDPPVESIPTAGTGSADRPGEGAAPEILTDGGRTLQAESVAGGADDEREAEEPEEGGYRSLFLDVAGTTELVDEQEGQDVSRDVDDDTASLSSYVASVAQEDGLVDTIDEPESGSAD